VAEAQWFSFVINMLQNCWHLGLYLQSCLYSTHLRPFSQGRVKWGKEGVEIVEGLLMGG